MIIQHRLNKKKKMSANAPISKIPEAETRSKGSQSLTLINFQKVMEAGCVSKYFVK